MYPDGCGGNKQQTPCEDKTMSNPNGFHEDFEDCPECEEGIDGMTPDEREEYEAWLDSHDEPQDFRDDVDADADALEGIGWGTDEDYGFFGDFDHGGEG
jgi:hypothetical protein